MLDMNQWEAAFRKGFAKPIILQILHDEGEVTHISLQSKFRNEPWEC